MKNIKFIIARVIFLTLIFSQNGQAQKDLKQIENIKSTKLEIIDYTLLGKETLNIDSSNNLPINSAISKRDTIKNKKIYDFLSNNLGSNTMVASTIKNRSLQIELGYKYGLENYRISTKSYEMPTGKMVDAYDDYHNNVSLNIRLGILKNKGELVFSRNYKIQTRNYPNVNSENLFEFKSRGVESYGIGLKYSLLNTKLFNKNNDSITFLNKLIPSISSYFGINSLGKSNIFFKPYPSYYYNSLSAKLGMILEYDVSNLGVLTGNLHYQKFNSFNNDDWNTTTDNDIIYISAKLTDVISRNNRLFSFIEWESIINQHHSDDILRLGVLYLKSEKFASNLFSEFNFKQTPAIFSFGIGLMYNIDKIPSIHFSKE